jgi:Leucine Rich repeat
MTATTTSTRGNGGSIRFVAFAAIAYIWRLATPTSASTTSSPSPSTSTPHYLDLSYRNQLTPDIVASRLNQFVNTHLTTGNTLHSDLVIDISHSNLGDAIGLQCIPTSSVLSNHNNNNNTSKISNTTATVTIDLMSRSNRLTSNHVTTFLNEIYPMDDDTMFRNETETNTTIGIIIPTFWRSFDFGWNLLYKSSASNNRQNKAFHTALQNVLIHPKSAIETLHLCCCGIGPATCRALAKGLLRRFEVTERNDNENITETNECCSPISLFLSNNPDIGDSGAAALAAAIRSIAGDRQTPILDTLDLSGCDISDVGMEAFALALEDAVAPVMIRRLLLCNNRITDQGALALGRALHRNTDGAEVYIDLSNNPLIHDRGITTLLSAVEKGCLSSLTLRSCSIQADGAELVGKTLRSLALHTFHTGKTIQLDLSGNPIGILRGKTDKGNIYSAKAIKSKASATATAYVSQGLNFLKKGLGSVGVTIGTEVDDDEEDKLQQSSDAGDDSDKTKNMRCGFKSLSNAFLANDQNGNHVERNDMAMKNIYLGLRRTFCDTAGADALAAMIMATKDAYKGIALNLELDLNPVVEEEMVNALHGKNDEILQEMAERHNEAMEIIQRAHERALTAAKVLTARRKQAAVSASQFDDYDTHNGDNMDEEFDDYGQEYDEENDGLWDAGSDNDDNEDY